MKIMEELWKWSLLLVGLIFLVALAGGCAPTASTEPLDKQAAGTPSNPLSPQRITVVPDLPVPAHMSIKRSISFGYEGAGGRTIDYTYEGWVGISRVHRFYLDQMPVSNWQLLADNYVRGVYTLTFRKEDEICWVTLSKNAVCMTVARLLIQKPQPSR